MISREFAVALADDAKRQGKPISALTTDLVRTHLRAREQGYDLEEVFELFDVMTFAKKMGQVLVPNEIYEDLITSSLSTNIDQTVRTSREEGRKMARYIETVRSDPVEGLRQLLPNIYWDMAFEIKHEGTRMSFCISFHAQTLGRANLVLAFIEGYLQACNFAIGSREVMPGLIRADFDQSSGPV